MRWADDAKDNYIRHAIRENNVQKQLKHPNIVTLYNTVEIDRTSFITVMEYCNGPDLSYYLRKHKCIPEKEAKLMIKQILYAIKYMHELLP
jgi:tousled-like kinase